MGGKRKQKLEKEERPSHNTDMNYIHTSPHLLTLFCSNDSLTRHYNVCLPRYYDYLILFNKVQTSTRNHERGSSFC